VGRDSRHRSTSWDDIGWTTAPDTGTVYSSVAVGDGDDAPRVFFLKFPPHGRVEAHTHDVDYCEIVLQGSQQVSGRWYHAGDLRVVKAGAGYGPLITGPDGCTVVAVFRDFSKFNQVFLPRRGRKAKAPMQASP
jgi:anti-sigma factor ChrR (cupin superfamily)